MKDIETVKLDQVIVHLVDSESDSPTLSTRALSVQKGSDLSSYFQDHIRNSLRDSSARTASFLESSSFSEVAKRALTLPGSFVEISQEIASHLHGASDRRISRGAVAICLYSSPDIPSIRRFLAILKLDPADGFHPVERSDPQGNLYVEFEKVEDVVPSKRERLLKCAFIRPLTTGEPFDYDMIVLDRQTASSQEPAKFFMTKFLGAEHFGDSTEMTRDFYSVGVRTVEKLRPTIGHKKAEDLRKSIDAALKGNSVDVEQWVYNLRIATSHKAELRTAIEAVIPDGQFDVDEKVAESMIKKRVFKAHGFRMTIDTDEYDGIVQERNDEDGYVEFVLRIRDLEEFVR